MSQRVNEKLQSGLGETFKAFQSKLADAISLMKRQPAQFLQLVFGILWYELNAGSSRDNMGTENPAVMFYVGVFV